MQISAWQCSGAPQREPEDAHHDDLPALRGCLPLSCLKTGQLGLREGSFRVHGQGLDSAVGSRTPSLKTLRDPQHIPDQHPASMTPAPTGWKQSRQPSIPAAFGDLFPTQLSLALSLLYSAF